MLDKAREDYEGQLKEVNGLRNMLTTIQHQYLTACWLLVRKRARYLRLAKKAGVEVPSPTWWEREGPQGEIVTNNRRRNA